MGIFVNNLKTISSKTMKIHKTSSHNGFRFDTSHEADFCFWVWFHPPQSAYSTFVDRCSVKCQVFLRVAASLPPNKGFKGLEFRQIGRRMSVKEIALLQICVTVVLKKYV